jgi:hypothetical protein
VDNWATKLLPGDSLSAEVWANAVFTVKFWPVLLLMKLRNLLVRALAWTGRAPAVTDLSDGLRPFTMLAGSDNEVILGESDSHLDFRVDLRVHTHFVSVATIVRIHNWLGRAYWAMVRPFHPVLVRAMLRRTPSQKTP